MSNDAQLTEGTRQRWLGHLYTTAPADRPLAEAGVRDMYIAAEMQPPGRILWLDSPAEAAWTVMLLDAQRDTLMRRIVEAIEKSRVSRERLAAVRAAVAKAANASWEAVAQSAGQPLWGQGANPQASFQLPLTLSRVSLWGDPGRAMGKFFEDPLFMAEAGLYGLFGRALGGGADTTFLRAITHAYNFLWMAMDEEKTQGASPPPFLEPAWHVARAAGPWWAFSRLALLTERPAELHRNAAGQPSRGDGPAILYRNGWKIYAWNGGSMPEKWILHPESIPPGELKHADKSFREYLATRMGASPKPAQKPARPSKILETVLPPDPALRLQQLSKHAGGKLPLYDRYMAGERSQAWHELQALGNAVRTEPHAADALAVAYETMRRVEANVRTVVERLAKLGYRFRTEASAWQEREKAIDMALKLDPRPSELGLRSPHVRKLMNVMQDMRGKLAAQTEAARKLPRDDTPRAHTPPPANTANLLKRVEKKLGTLPLSLRTFYEVVGAVDLQGSHLSLSPDKSAICPDPLVVFPLEDVLAGTEEMAEDDGDIRLQLAPDDIHKAGESGGEPYEIAVPDARADGEFLNERHGLFFVDYLRLTFRFGGFPGYDGYDRDLPPEIAQLSNALIDF